MITRFMHKFKWNSPLTMYKHSAHNVRFKNTISVIKSCSGHGLALTYLQRLCCMCSQANTILYSEESHRRTYICALCWWLTYSHDHIHLLYIAEKTHQTNYAQSNNNRAYQRERESDEMFRQSRTVVVPLQRYLAICDRQRQHISRRAKSTPHTKCRRTFSQYIHNASIGPRKHIPIRVLQVIVVSYSIVLMDENAMHRCYYTVLAMIVMCVFESKSD